MPEPPLKVYGLAQLRKALRELADKDTMDRLKTANVHAAETVVDAAKGRAGTRLQRKAAETLEVARTVRAAVRFGAGFRGALGAEFGSAQNVRRRVNHFGNYTGWNQFEGWKGNGPEAGYFLWPAIRDKSDEIMQAYADEIADLFGE